MARNVEQIEHDLARLNERLAAIGQTLHETYSNYLTVLGQAVKQQLIGAAYQICTQGYPEQFLSLSLAQRQQFQQALQQVAKQGQAQLSELLSRDDGQHNPSSEQVEQKKMDPVPLAQVLAFLSRGVSQASPNADEGQPSSGLTQPDAGQSASESLQNSLRFSRPRRSPPTALLHWHESIEQAIAEMLRHLSRQVNHLLQESGILPKYFPEPVLEAAAKAEAFETMAAGPPNLLSLTVEAIELPTEDNSSNQKSEKPKSSGTTVIPPLRIMAVQMRLSEIEFVDSSVMSWRNRLRETILQLKALEQDYQKVQRELAVANAEAAWRSSWVSE
ncbi:MAG: hypothetical protein NZ772_01735 [Cyanobacteria bacterium]|nr:hypothetical protein [Cyanobacteriota bacterium]MDW8199993.1 hypothetical protein [Cyanobacteriota bacterium SKYGB_h_bin112]